MPRERSPNRDKAKELWLVSGKTRLLKDIAKELEVSEEQIRKWKSQDKWEADKKVTLPKNKSNVTKKKLTPKEEKKQIKRLELDEAELTEKQRLFCLYYIKNFNATQAAIKAGYSPNSAMEIGYQLLHKTSVRAEIDRLKQLKRQSIMISEDDIVERYMRIAFADMTDFVEFGQEDVPIMTMFGPLEVEDPDTGEKKTLTKRINVVKFKDADMVDGGLICQIKQGKDGASLKLEDRQKALEWLSNFFNMNPMDKHKQEYDKRKLEIELLKAEAQLNKSEGVGGDTNTPTDDGFLDALNACAGEAWDDVEGD
jgi:phage terminase small subunit